MEMSFLHAFILGVVEGVSEFLPISSTGHLIFVSYFLGLEQTDFLKMFEVVIQFGAILSVIVLYFKKISSNLSLLLRLGVALVPSLVVGGVLYTFIKGLFDSERVVAWALLLGGVLIILFEMLYRGPSREEKNELSSISYTTAFLVGMFQAISVIPGVSRAGATILGGLLLGMKRSVVVEFSFLLAVPTMLAASVLDIYQNGMSVLPEQWTLLLVGFITAFFVALITVRWFIRFVQTNTFIAFGVYRIALALFLLMFVIV